MSFIRKLVPITLFVVALFVVIEFSYRFYVVGPIALNPFRANSLNTLMRSEFVQLSEYPDVFFELKPDAEGWFKGVRFATNSAGMADQEYAFEKPEDVFRIAVAGSSWTMGSGVETDQSWHAVLERRLTESDSHPRIEMLNFGVELYGLREIVGAIRHKALDWNPDLVIVAITSFTTSLLWEEPTDSQTLPDRVYPFFESYLLRALANVAGLPNNARPDDRRRIGSDEGRLRIHQLQRALRELGEMSAANEVPVAVVLLGYVSFGPKAEAAIMQQAAQSGVTVVFANSIFPPAGKARLKLQISPFDRHPNESGHELIAGYIGEALAAERLLPN